MDQQLMHTHTRVTKGHIVGKEIDCCSINLIYLSISLDWCSSSPFLRGFWWMKKKWDGKSFVKGLDWGCKM